MYKTQRKNIILLIVPLLVGWSFDFLMIDKPFGINFTIFITLLLAGGFFLANIRGVRPAMNAVVLVLPILFLSIFTAFRLEPFTHVFSLLLMLLGLVLLVITFRGGRWQAYSVSDIVEKSFVYGMFVLSKPFQWLVEQASRPRTISDDQNKRLWASVLRGVLISIPILFVLTVLLSSADDIFRKNIESVFSELNWENLIGDIFRVLVVAFISIFVAVTYAFAHTRSDDTQLRGLEKEGIPTFVGQIETIVVLSLVNLLFFLFVIVQFQYLFGGAANIHVDGFTYSEYARKGFGELAFVAALSLILLQVVHSVTRSDEPKFQLIQKILSTVLVAQLLVILFSAYQRLTLYESAYGFSRVRAYTHIFLVWIALLLITVMILELKQRSRLFPLAVILVAFCFGVTINFFNIDARITKWNIDRAKVTGELDIPYISSLTLDAMPVLVNEFTTVDKPELKNMIGAAILCLEDAQSYVLEEERTWLSTSFALDRGVRALNSIKPALTDVSIGMDDNAMVSVEVDGARYNCYTSYAD